MARPLRIEYPGAFYHVMNRGQGGEEIFIGERDRRRFLHYLEKTVEQYSIVVHTFCLMPNHYHLLLETPLPNLSRAVQWLHVSYATYFNREHQRKGHLFQGRYKALLVDADAYLLALSRYIHLNPVRAGMVKTPAEYAWGSYSAIVGRSRCPAWLETGRVLGAFPGKRSVAIKEFRHFVEGGDAMAQEDPGRNASGGFILGDRNFLDWATGKFLPSRKEEKEVPQLKKLKPRPTVDKIVDAVCKEFECEKETLLHKGRKRNLARDVAIHLSRAFSGLSCVDLGKRFGGISGSAVTMRHRKIDKTLLEDETLRDRVEQVGSRIMNI